MAERRRKTSRSHRRPAPAHRSGARRAALALFVLVLVGAAAVVITSGLAQKGVREVTLPLRHDDVIRQQARDKKVDAALIAAVIYAESRFKDQTSHADARGLMQITPETGHEIEKLSGGTAFELEDLRDPELNIRYGTFYLRHLLDRFGNNAVAALAAYNAGPSNAARWGGSAMKLDDIVDLDGRDFSETRGYVKNVLEKQREYRHKYALELGY